HYQILSSFNSLFFSYIPPHPLSTLFPYTTLFRSGFCTRSSSPAPPPTASAISSQATARSGRRGCSRASLRSTLGARAKKLWNSRSEEHTSELQSRSDLVCRLLLEKKKNII